MRLPWELVQLILEYAVEVLPLPGLFQARLVNTTFADDIFTLLLKTSRLDDEAWSCSRLGTDEAIRKWTTFPDRLRRKYLYQKIQQHEHSPCVYSEFVHEAIDSQGQLSPGEREEFISKMIDATWWKHYQFNNVFCPDKRDQWKKWYATQFTSYYFARRLPPLAPDIQVALLCSAIRRNDTAAAQNLLDEGVGMHEVCYRFDVIPLEVAAKWGGREITAMLIKNGEPIEYDLTVRHSKCAFTIAAKNRNREALESYIAHCKPPGTYCSVSAAMIKAAKTMARIGDIEMLDFLGERYKRDISILRYEALIAAIECGQFTTMQHILNLGGFDLNMRTKSSPKGLLFSAIYDTEPKSRLAAVKVLLENGVDPNQGFPGVSATALQKALDRGDEQTARILIEYGADVNATRAPEGNKKLAPPVLLAARRGLPLISLMLEKGADTRFTWRGKQHVVKTGDMSHIEGTFLELGWEVDQKLFYSIIVVD